MSYISLQLVKDDLRLTHDSDDNILQVYLDASEDEALRYMNRTELPTLPVEYPEESSEEEIPSTGDDIAASVYAAVFLLVRAKYEAATPEQIASLRKCAETLLTPYRTEMGI